MRFFFQTSNQLAGLSYPSVIMGCDALVDFLPHPQKISSVEKRRLLQYAYNAGVRGFDVSVCPHFIAAYRTLLRDTQDSSVVGIGNPNWRCGFKLHQQDLWDVKDRILQTLSERFFTTTELESIAALPPDLQARWFLPRQEVLALTAAEIDTIYLDIAQFNAKLSLLEGVVRFVVFGSDYLEWFVKLNRLDLIQQGLSIVRARGFIPLSISHWPSVTAPVLNTLGFEGHWIHYNALEQLINPDGALTSIQQLKKPVTIFRVLSAGKLASDVDAAVAFVMNRVTPISVVIGVTQEVDIDHMAESFHLSATKMSLR